MKSGRFLPRPSATVPSTGPRSAMISVAAEEAYPQNAVESASAIPCDAAMFLKKIGMIVETSIINAELPTSYKIQDLSSLVSFIFSYRSPHRTYVLF